MSALISEAIVEGGATLSFAHPILRAAIYDDLSATERERLHGDAARILRERGAPPLHVAAQVMHTEPAADAEAVELLRAAAREALGLGDATGAALLLARALEEPPADRRARRGHARAGSGSRPRRRGGGGRAAVGDRRAQRGRGRDRSCGDRAERDALLRGARRGGGRRAAPCAGRLSAEGPAAVVLEVALLGVSSTSASARREADQAIAALRDPGGPARDAFEATVLATLAMDDAVNARSAAHVRDLAERAIAAGLPLEPHRGENWALLALGVLGAADGLDAALRGVDDILGRARERGAVLTVVTVSSLRALICFRRGDLNDAEADAHASIELAPTLLGARFVVLAVAAAILAGLEREETPESLRRLVERTGVWYDEDFTSSSQLRFASGVLRAAAGNHQDAVEELLACGEEPRVFGGENPALLPWRSAAALSLAELGRHEEARALADDEARRAESFGAARALGIALRARALVGPTAERTGGLERAVEVLAPSPARLEHARALVDLGAALRAAGKRTDAREPLRDGLALAARCGGLALETRARAELAAVGVRPRTTDRTGSESLTPSELRVARLAAEGATNREIAQTLFVTEKTVETHLGRSFRKLDISSGASCATCSRTPPADGAARLGRNAAARLSGRVSASAPPFTRSNQEVLVFTSFGARRAARGTRSAARRVLARGAFVVLLALGAMAASAWAFQALPAGQQVNDDLGAGIDKSFGVSGEGPGNADVVGGSLSAGKPAVPWAIFRQRESKESVIPRDQVFARSFAKGAWTTRGAGTVGGRSSAAPQFPGSLNFDQETDGEAPSIDFAGSERTVPWATWYESTKGKDFENDNIFASRFDNTGDANQGKWIFGGQARGLGGGAVQVPSLNIDTNQSAENPSVAGGSAVDPSKPGPWVTFQEFDGVEGVDQIFVERPIGPGAANCDGVTPEGVTVDGHVPAIGGFCWQQTGIPRGGVDPTLNVDPSRAGEEPDIAFAGASDGVPWVVWYEAGQGGNGLDNNEQVFAARAVKDGEGATGGFHWEAVGSGLAATLDRSGARGLGKCAESKANEEQCSLNRDPSANAEKPRVAAGTMNPANPTGAVGDLGRGSRGHQAGVRLPPRRRGRRGALRTRQRRQTAVSGPRRRDAARHHVLGQHPLRVLARRRGRHGIGRGHGPLRQPGDVRHGQQRDPGHAGRAGCRARADLLGLHRDAVQRRRDGLPGRGAGDAVHADDGGYGRARPVRERV